MDGVMSRVGQLALVGIAIGLLTVAALMPASHVTAVGVSATAHSALSTSHCVAGDDLAVSFVWHGRMVTARDAPNCDRSYSVGDAMTVYVASNDPSIVGLDANWILHPDTHDSFDFIGPNGLRSFLASLGVFALAGAAVWFGVERRRWRHLASA
jgi:hypothetical protein